MRSSSELQWLQAVAWVIDNIDPELTSDRMAAAIGVHPNHLSRLCRRHTGERLSDFLTRLRIERAKDLLASGDLPIKDIVSLSGYRDETHFRKRFKLMTGHTPGVWRRQLDPGKAGLTAASVQRLSPRR